MTNQIVIITDYKGFFSSKQKSPLYRGGMDIPKLITIFRQYGFDVKVMQFPDIRIEEIVKNNPLVLYTSSEDLGDLYKSYIEDAVFHLQEAGVRVFPKFSYLRAHNNKVAMEFLRMRSDFRPIQTIQSYVFGTLEELEQNIQNCLFPVVIKTAEGAKSRGVAKADNPQELIKIVKDLSRARHYRHDLKELLRKIKYGGTYVRESFYRKKFVVQNFIPNLNNDWKVLVYGHRCYVLFRGNRKNDFRASGSGKFEFRKDIPPGILDYVFNIKEFFNVPHISLDIGFDGEHFHLIEFQFIHFGTTTIEKAPFHFERNGEWVCVENASDLEVVYVESIVRFLSKNIENS